MITFIVSYLVSKSQLNSERISKLNWNLLILALFKRCAELLFTIRVTVYYECLLLLRNILPSVSFLALGKQPSFNKYLSLIQGDKEPARCVHNESLIRRTEKPRGNLASVVQPMRVKLVWGLVDWSTLPSRLGIHQQTWPGEEHCENSLYLVSFYHCIVCI